jgi:phosphatidylserine/phosphatidylglycerophosphate/cardiolipin synthase-like enzyme
MQDHQVKEALRESLADGQLERSERDAFRDWLRASPPDAQKRAVYQSMAFDLASDAIDRRTVPHYATLNWLERVVKLLGPATDPAPAAAPAAAAIAEACFSPQHDCAGRIGTLFGQASRSVDVCVFTITDDRITRALLGAHRRRVRLRVITDDEKCHDPGSDIEQLRNAGVDIRCDNTAFHMHHKFALFDGGLLLTGSYNWTRSAALHNEENFILTNEGRLLRSFQKLFEDLWAQFAGTA